MTYGGAMTTTVPTTEADVPLGGGRSMRVALELPAGTPPEGGWPGVVVLHEIFGLTPEIRAVGTQFAERGWAAAVPDFFSSGTKLGCLVKAVREVASHKPGRISDDLATVAGWLGGRAEVDADQLGTIGFCLGGSFALLLGAIDGTGLKAVSVNYGDLPKAEYVEKLPPTVGSYGGRDLTMRGRAEKLEKTLTACGIAHDVKTYADAGHSFLTPAKHPVAQVMMGPVMHPGYVADAAEDAWPRIMSFLDEHVKA